MSGTDVAAYFDLDGTLLDASSEKTLTATLLKKRPWRLPITMSMWTLRCLGSLMIGRTWYDSARNRGHFTLSTWKELDSLSKQIVKDNLSKRVPQQSIDRIAWHKQQGHRVVIISATIVPMAEAMAEFLDADEVYGCGPETRQGRLSGSEKGWLVPRNKGKINIVKNDAAKNNHDLTKCWGYGNSHADAHFMELCGNVMAVNPDARLAKQAEAKDWEQVVWKM